MEKLASGLYSTYEEPVKEKKIRTKPSEERWNPEQRHSLQMVSRKSFYVRSLITLSRNNDSTALVLEMQSEKNVGNFIQYVVKASPLPVLVLQNMRI